MKYNNNNNNDNNNVLQQAEALRSGEGLGARL